MTVATVMPSSGATASGNKPGQASGIASDFNTFLRMLTVQMQNQDPLNPIDSADYAVQLATFSGVEQQVRTNQLLSEMTTRFQQIGMAEMASWVGKEARTDAMVRFDGRPVTLSPNPAQGATRAVLEVRDAQGRLVAREEIPVTAEPYAWLGADAAGNPLPPGAYSLKLESLRGEEVIFTGPMEHYARVVEVRGTPAGTSLVLAGGSEVSANRVTALREAR
ncbi:MULTISPECIES: flagellar hook capping FlgD N-terminal domain-containing protein [Tabrizicola]|uniref:flagellar hook capping FlgD N-terminal domain-containing protein n=1 Tax=Tabrizicola TaxID=1443919 RepID=UPI001080887C|nr:MULTISPECIES: flagellar hook capping FlgD N-terminal domain-containing protein [Paracoccaceae]